MKRLLDKVACRHLEIIEYMNKRDDWVSKTELMAQFSISQRTIENDLEFIDATFSDLHIIHYLEAYRLETSNAITIRQISSQLFWQISSLEIIEKVFLGELNTLHDIMVNYYISESTLYRRIKALNQLLSDKFDIEFQPTVLEFAGLEPRIRHYFLRYFFEKYGTTGWPFPNIERQAVDNFLEFTFKILGIHIDFGRYQLIRYTCAINLLRALQGFKTNRRSQEIQRYYELAKEIDYFQQLNANFQNKFDRPLDLDMLNELLFGFIGENLLKNKDDLALKAYNNPLVHKSVTHLKSISQTLSDQFQIPLEQTNGLLIELHNEAYLEFNQISVRALFYSRRHHYLQQIKYRFPEFYQAAWTLFAKYAKEVWEVPDEDMCKTLVFNLLIYWDGLYDNLLLKKRPLHVLVMSDMSKMHAKQIAQQFRIVTSPLIEVEVYEDYTLHDYCPIIERTDIILSNFPLVIPGKHVVYYNDTISKEVMSQLYRTIDDLYNGHCPPDSF